MRASHEIAGEASNHPSRQLNHLGALDADTTDAGPERTPWHRRRTVNADDQFNAAVNDQKRPAKELADALAIDSRGDQSRSRCTTASFRHGVMDKKGLPAMVKVLAAPEPAGKPA